MSTRPIHLILGTVILLDKLFLTGTTARRRDERGLSQSTENAILLAGAVAVAGIVIAAITTYVKGKMPQ